MERLLGVYEQLISSIKITSGKVLKLALRGKFREAAITVPWRFLLPLGLGLAAAVVTLSNVLEWVLQKYPVFLWAFFFGLVLASVYLVGKRVPKWETKTYVSFIFTTILAYIVVGAVPMETPQTALAMFLAGAIAICAMILPGVSGSFLLVIMGKYGQVLGAVTERDFVTLAIFGAGIIVGISLFSRLLSWLLAKYYNVAMAALTGFMFGSLRKIWPWKVTLETQIDRHGVEVPVSEINVLPERLDSGVLFAVGLAVFGICLIIYLASIDKKVVRKE